MELSIKLRFIITALIILRLRTISLVRSEESTIKAEYNGEYCNKGNIIFEEVEDPNPRCAITVGQKCTIDGSEKCELDEVEQPPKALNEDFGKHGIIQIQNDITKHPNSGDNPDQVEITSSYKYDISNIPTESNTIIKIKKTNYLRIAGIILAGIAIKLLVNFLNFYTRNSSMNTVFSHFT